MSVFLNKESRALVWMYRHLILEENEHTTFQEIGEALGYDKETQHLIAQNLVLELTMIEGIGEQQAKISLEDMDQNWEEVRVYPITLNYQGKIAGEELVRFVEQPHFNTLQRDYAI